MAIPGGIALDVLRDIKNDPATQSEMCKEDCARAIEDVIALRLEVVRQKERANQNAIEANRLDAQLKNAEARLKQAEPKDPRGIADVVAELEAIAKSGIGGHETMITNNEGDSEECEVSEVIDAAVLEIRALRAKLAAR